jgi:hypothetical protein
MEVMELIASLGRLARRNSPPRRTEAVSGIRIAILRLSGLQPAPLRMPFFGQRASSRDFSEALPLRELDDV